MITTVARKQYLGFCSLSCYKKSIVLPQLLEFRKFQKGLKVDPRDGTKDFVAHLNTVDLNDAGLLVTGNELFITG